MILASSFYNVLYIVLAIFGILALGGLSGKERDVKKKKLKRSEVEISYRNMPDPQVRDYFTTYVAGARFYTSNQDLRCFVGFVYFDPEDEVPRVYRNDLHMLGHIPRERTEEYIKWCPGDVYPCVGYILRGSNYEDLVSELRIIRPYNREYVEQEIKNYVGWAVMTHGINFNISPEKYDPILDQADIDKINKKRKRKDDSQ